MQFLVDVLFPRQQQHASRRGLTVIGAGFSRTGTKSTGQALQLLGHEHIYDVRSILKHNHTARWIRAGEEWKEHGTVTELSSLVADMEEAGYTATLGNPTAFFALPLALKVRLHAKVSLTVRDSAESWWQSLFTMMKTNRTNLHLPTLEIGLSRYIRSTV